MQPELFSLVMLGWESRSEAVVVHVRRICTEAGTGVCDRFPSLFISHDGSRGCEADGGGYGVAGVA